jgi:hypothetical protein
MISEFRKKLEEICVEKGFDIIDSEDEYVIISYAYMTFTVEPYMYNNTFNMGSSLASVYIKGREYECNDYDIIASYELEYSEYENINNAIDELIYFIESCNVRKRMLSAINAVDSLIKDSDDADFIISYINNTYE